MVLHRFVDRNTKIQKIGNLRQNHKLEEVVKILSLADVQLQSRQCVL